MFGIPFLQAYYTIHDLDEHKFGLVRLNKEEEVLEPYQGAISYFPPAA